jgi:HD-GYP domain-containing protein (c-di-GMP phosphodiesterase class II)
MQIEEIAISGLLHDIGALKLTDKIDALNECDEGLAHQEIGYNILSKWETFKSIAEIVRHHHASYSKHKIKDIPFSSYIVHVADRIDANIDKKIFILEQSDTVIDHFCCNRNKWYPSDLVDLIASLGHNECFWLDITSNELMPSLICEIKPSQYLALTNEESCIKAVNFCEIISSIVDFRSPFTVAHSRGVAACAAHLAGIMNYSSQEVAFIKIAAFLHDIGKLAIPAELIEKNGKLTASEFKIIKTHPYRSYHLLKTIPRFDIINDWASLHHEKISGQGYPFHKKNHELSLGSRIMSVSDVLTATTEDRPYRAAMSKQDVVAVLQSMERDSSLCPHVVEVALHEMDRLRQLVNTVKIEAAASYRETMTCEQP